MSNLDTKQKIFMGVMYALASISIIVIILVIYNIIGREKPQTLGTVYANTLSCSDEDINIAEVKIHANENNNGQACYEILWNGYTDYLGSAIKGFGMQSPIKDDYSGKTYNINGEQFYTYIDNVTLYNTDDNSKSSYVVNDIPNELYIDIDGKFYKIVFETFTYKLPDTSFIGSLFGRTKEYSDKYNFYTLFDYILEASLSDSAKHDNGEYSIALLDLSKYIKFYYQDDDTQYKPLDEASTMYEFLKIKVTYSKDGLTEASQSMFKQYQGNSSWSFYNNTNVENYWNAYAELNLTEENVNYVYNDTKSSYYITIDKDFSKYLSKLTNAEISINIDLTALNFDVYGIDLQHFNFKINSFEISGNVDSFKLYNENLCSVTPTLKVV